MRTHNKRGSLLVTMLFSIALLAIVGGLLALSISSVRLTARNEFRAQARTIAESELEHLYYLFQDRIVCGIEPDAVPADLAGKGVVDNALTPSTDASPYLTTHRTGWTVRRSMHFTAKFDGVDADTGDVGETTYVEVRVEVVPPAGTPWSGQSLRFARQFSSSSSVVFQNCVFYQGDLEMAPGGDATFSGNIVANGSIYLGASSGGTLTLKGNVSYLKNYGFNTNPGSDGLFGTADDTGIYSTYRKPDTPVSGTITAPTFYYSQSQQLKELSEAANFLGGVDAVAIQASNTDLFPTVNDVYRSVIVPPPSAGNTNEYTNPSSLTDSPAMAAQRTYNQAGLVLTVDTGGTITITNQASGAAVDVTTALSSVVTQKGNVWDQREGRNVAVTEIDIGKLKDLVGTGKTGFSTFNGLLYVNLKNGTATSPAAVRLVNATELPKSGTSGDKGFSVVTNGGLYVQGNYNTTTLADGSVAKSMIMADAMTVLSGGWSDANAANATVSARTASGDVTIKAALMLGNTPASTTTASGGAQNLVRYLEDWSGRTVNYYGSIGRLFDSKIFTRPWQQPGSVYIQPKLRNFEFDTNLREDGGPPGAITISRTARGRFYQW